MSWYFVLLNVLFAATVLGAIVGPHLWVIASKAGVTPQPELTPHLVPRPAV